MNDSFALIIGRPNVGKSSLFNRLIEQNRSLVHDTSGVTRDWIEGKIEGRYRILDTGGLDGITSWNPDIRAEVKSLCGDASLVLFVFDAKEGLTPSDQTILSDVRAWVKPNIPILGVINKLDHPNHDFKIGEFFGTGISNLMGVSTKQGRGIDELRAEIIKHLKEVAELNTSHRIALVGRPNVGKSSIFNRLIQQDRSIVSPIAGTTSDWIEGSMKLGSTSYTLLDTAGIRRKSKTEQGVEVLSVLATGRAIRQSELALLVLDASSAMTEQDEKVAGLLIDSGVKLIVVYNKCDQISIEDRKKLRNLHFFSHATHCFLSATSGMGFSFLKKEMRRTLQSDRPKLSTKDLTDFLKSQMAHHTLDQTKIYLCFQVSKKPMRFALRVNHTKNVTFSTKRYLTNLIRKRYALEGVPVELKVLPRK